MRTRACVLFLLAALGLTLSSAANVKSQPLSPSQPLHIIGYYREDGTYVPVPDRSLPGYGHHPRPAPAYHAPRESHAAPRPTHAPPSLPHPYRRDSMADRLTPHRTVQRDSRGGIKRSQSAKNAFKREHPCPANSHTSGSCPGYVIDHVEHR